MTMYPAGGSGWLLDEVQHQRDFWDWYVQRVTLRDATPPCDENRAAATRQSGRSGELDK